MSFVSRPLAAACACSLFAACGESVSPIDGLPRELSVAEGKLIEADNRFAFSLFSEVNELEGAKNIFISPLSVGMALSMTYNGAAGSTRDAMQQALELQDMTLQEVNESYRSLIDLLRNLDPQVQFLLANSIWYRNTMTFQQAFLDLNRQYFDAEVTGLDFGSPNAVTTMNDWVSDKTMGRIEEIVDSPIDPLTIMFLINAIYFKGDWTYQFDKNQTRNAPFTLANGSETTVEMMSHRGEAPVRYASDGGVQLVDMAYGGRAYSMTIVLPAAAQDVAALAGGLTQDQWNGWIAALDSTSLVVSMPKFRLEYDLELKAALTALGMGIAFTESADFTNLFAPGGVYINKVKHKTFVDVNEEGTEAAAVTSVEMTLTSTGGPVRIVIDRPFLFAIRENYSGTILFMGKIMDPRGT